MNLVNDSLAIPILAAIAGAVVALLLSALFRGRSFTGLALLVGAVLAGAWLSHAGLAFLAATEHAAERRTLDERRALLAARAMEPNSLSTCVTGLAGDTVQDACESVVFASPQSVAAAVAEAAERLTLLADSLDYARRVDPTYETAFAELRLAAENDAYGLYAHVLAVRDGCNADRCAVFAGLSDPGALKVHLRERLYDNQIAKNSTRWQHPAAPETPPVASAPSSQNASAPSAAADTNVAAAPTTAAAAPIFGMVPAIHGVVPPFASVLPNIDFPSSDSIPPVSIMTPEPRAATPAAAEPRSSQPTPSPVPMPRVAPRGPPQSQERP